MADATKLTRPLLALRGLTRRYAGLVAVDAVDLDLPAGGVHALIGPNGAGKTTLFDLISGLARPSSGRVLLDGLEISALPADGRARLGLGRTFQAIRLFGEMTVLENVLVGLHARLGGEAARRRTGQAALDRVGLGDQRDRLARALPYGDQRRLEIARAAAAAPRLLLLDEPAAGMNPVETRRLAGLVRDLAASGPTVLLVEHDMRFVMDLADTVTVLSFGRLIFHGAAAAARADPAVIEAYLGHDLAHRLGRSA